MSAIPSVKSTYTKNSAATSVCEAIPHASGAIMSFALMYDVPVPLELFKLVISRSTAFKARADGKLHLEEVASRAAIRPSELARYLNRSKPSTVSVLPDRAA
ncbi:MAG: hypothetical protein ACOZE5_18340 [Verrucomicrobiota bacterium]